MCEVHFAYDDNLNLFFRSLPSRRHCQEIAKNPKVAGNIVTQHFLGQTVRGVYFEGTAQMLPAGEEQNRAAECIIKRLHTRDSIIEEAKASDGPQFYKISVETFYVFDAYTTNPGQKYELKWNGGSRQT